MYFEYEIWKEESIAVLNLWSFVVVAVIAIVIGCLNSLLLQSCCRISICGLLCDPVSEDCRSRLKIFRPSEIYSFFIYFSSVLLLSRDIQTKKQKAWGSFDYSHYHRGLRSERNLIHLNLSLSIGTFQIIFLAGIEATSNEVGWILA